MTTGESMASIAAGFAAKVNAEALVAGSAFAGLNATVTAEGTLLIADISGRDLAAAVGLKPVAEAAIDGGSATTTLVDLIGTPKAGDFWRLRIGDLMYSVEIVGTMSLAQIAADLAAQLNGDNVNAGRYTALVEGARIIIVDREGGVFDTRVDAGNISRYEGYAEIVLDYDLPAVDTDASDGIDDLTTQLKALYGFDGITVSEVRNDGDVTYTVSFVRDQAGIDFQQTQPVGNAAAGLLPSPNASVAVSTGTIRNGALVNTGVNVLQTVSINPNVTGGTFTLWFRVPDGKGGFDLVETAPIAYNATATEVYKAVSPILNPNGSTIDIDPEFDRVTRDPSKPFTDNFAVYQVGGVYLVTMQGAYRDLAIHDVDTRNLTTQELTTDPVQHEAPAATVTLGSTDGTAVVDATAPRATTVDLTGKAFAAGQDWTVDVTLRGITTTHTYTVGVSDSLAHIAQMLAASINANAADVFTATNDGAVLVIVNRDGSTFATSLAIDAAPAGGVQVIDRSTPSEAMVNLDGTPAANEIWQITLDDGATTPAVLSYTVAAGNELKHIAIGLAAAINSGANADFTAVAEGDSVVIVRRDGTVFSATPEVLPAGQPLAGEDWTVTLRARPAPR